MQVGDELFARDGSPTKVLKRFDHTEWPFYRVEFDDGSSTLAGPEHLWAVRGRKERRRGIDGWRVMSTQDILDAGVLRSNGAAQVKQWEIPTQGPAQFPHRETPIDPYVLGVWLGDGTKGVPMFSKPYPEIAEKISSRGVRVTPNEDGDVWYLPGVMDDFRKISVFSRGSHERFVPDEYKYNSIEVRRDVLEGLLDTDGECNTGGSIIYATTSKQLAEDVIWLARSLGGKAQLQPTVKKAWYPDPENGERKYCRLCWRVTLNLPWNPFTLGHRKERYTPCEERYTKRWISKIEFSHYGDGHCVVVDNDEHLYQANDFIVTHNSAETAWIILWAMSTRPQLAGWVTANTKAQLQSKTWRELALWHKRAINAHWFEWTATRFYHTDHKSTWGVDAIPWSENNSEAFAGLHADHVLMIMDESSAISDVIWEVAEGAMTTPRAMWFCFGNPTRNTGRFRECFGNGKFKHRWHSRQIDSRKCRMTNKEQLEEWLVDYGDDSDFARVRVKGEFPRAGSMQFIPSDLVENAREEELPIEVYRSMPIVLGADIARFGDDASVILVRQGRKVHSLKRFRGLDTQQMASMISAEIGKWRPHAAFIDEGGVGAGVVDRLVALGQRIIPVDFGKKATDSDTYYNKRAECWGRMRDWLPGADIPSDDQELADELVSPEYSYTIREQIQIERARDMKKRGLSSPDSATALAITFAEPVFISEQASFEPDPDFFD